MLLQAYELLQGNLVRFSPDANTKDVPTAVLVHGILGSKRNLNSFARMIVEVCINSSCHASCRSSHVIISQLAPIVSIRLGQLKGSFIASSGMLGPIREVLQADRGTEGY